MMSLVSTGLHSKFVIKTTNVYEEITRATQAFTVLSCNTFRVNRKFNLR